MSDTRRNPNGTWAKGQCGNPGGIPGGGGPQPGSGGSRMAHVRRLQEAIGRGNLSTSDLQKIANADANPIKQGAASHILAPSIKTHDAATSIP